MERGTENASPLEKGMQMDVGRTASQPDSALGLQRPLLITGGKSGRPTLGRRRDAVSQRRFVSVKAQVKGSEPASELTLAPVSGWLGHVFLFFNRKACVYFPVLPLRHYSWIQTDSMWVLWLICREKHGRETWHSGNIGTAWAWS